MLEKELEDIEAEIKTKERHVHESYQKMRNDSYSKYLAIISFIVAFLLFVYSMVVAVHSANFSDVITGDAVTTLEATFYVLLVVVINFFLFIYARKRNDHLDLSEDEAFFSLGYSKHLDSYVSPDHKNSNQLNSYIGKWCETEIKSIEKEIEDLKYASSEEINNNDKRKSELCSLKEDSFSFIKKINIANKVVNADFLKNDAKHVVYYYLIYYICLIEYISNYHANYDFELSHNISKHDAVDSFIVSIKELLSLNDGHEFLKTNSLKFLSRSFYDSAEKVKLNSSRDSFNDLFDEDEFQKHCSVSISNYNTFLNYDLSIVNSFISMNGFESDSISKHTIYDCMAAILVREHLLDICHDKGASVDGFNEDYYNFVLIELAKRISDENIEIPEFIQNNGSYLQKKNIIRVYIDSAINLCKNNKNNQQITDFFDDLNIKLLDVYEA